MVLAAARTRPIVAVTTMTGTRGLPVNLDRLAHGLDGQADLVAFDTGAATRELKNALPARLDVCDGASRIWWPGLARASSPHDHPLIPLAMGHAKAIEQRIVAIIRAVSRPPRPREPPADQRSHSSATPAVATPIRADYRTPRSSPAERQALVAKDTRASVAASARGRPIESLRDRRAGIPPAAMISSGPGSKPRGPARRSEDVTTRELPRPGDGMAIARCSRCRADFRADRLSAHQSACVGTKAAFKPRPTSTAKPKTKRRKSGAKRRRSSLSVWTVSGGAPSLGKKR